MCSRLAGCTEPNDLMADTPEMAGPQFACAPVDSCPDRPAAQGRQDPIHNFMVRFRSL